MVLSGSGTDAAATASESQYTAGLDDNACPPKPDSIPSVAVLALSNFAASLAVMVPGLIFGSSASVTDEWKAGLRKITGSTIGKSSNGSSKSSGASSRMSSAANSKHSSVAPSETAQ